MPARHTLCLICQPLLMVRAEPGSAHDDSQLLGGPAIATLCNPPRHSSGSQGTGAPPPFSDFCQGHKALQRGEG